MRQFFNSTTRWTEINFRVAKSSIWLERESNPETYDQRVTPFITRPRSPTILFIFSLNVLTLGRRLFQGKLLQRLAPTGINCYFNPVWWSANCLLTISAFMERFLNYWEVYITRVSDIRTDYWTFIKVDENLTLLYFSLQIYRATYTSDKLAKQLEEDYWPFAYLWIHVCNIKQFSILKLSSLCLRKLHDQNFLESLTHFTWKQFHLIP